MTADPAEGILDSLSSIDPYEFEQFVAALWERQGWDATVSEQSRDAGIDITVKRTDPFEQTQLIQAKRYAQSNKVSSSEIQQYASLRQQVPNADTVIVATTSDFTSDARARADDLNVKLVDGATLLQVIDDHDAYDLVEQYTDDTPSPTADDVTADPSVAESGDGDTTEEEMSTGEAVVAVLQGLVALGIILFILFLLVRTLVF